MSSGDQRWLEPLWLASGNPQCSVILSFQVLGFISSEQTRQKSNPETQITGKQGSWPVWDSHGSPGTYKGFLCAVWIQFLGQLPFSRDISKGQQEAGHELCWPAEAPSSPSIPQERGWKPGWAAWWNVSRRNARKSPRAHDRSTELDFSHLHRNCQQSLQRDTVHLGKSRRGCWAWSSGKRQAVERAAGRLCPRQAQGRFVCHFPRSETPADPA